MKHCLHLIIIIIAWSLTGCGGDNSVRQIPHLGDTPYQQDSVLVTYATNPKRALTLLDSALLLGNISDYRSQFIRARIYSKSLVEQQQDSAILICKSLLSHDSVRNNATEQMNIWFPDATIPCNKDSLGDYATGHTGKPFTLWTLESFRADKKKGQSESGFNTLYYHCQELKANLTPIPVLTQ